MLNPLVGIKGPPSRPSHIPPSHIHYSSCLANTHSSLSKLPLAQRTWPSEKPDQPQAHQSCLPSRCSCLSWAKQLCPLPCLIALHLLHVLHSERSIHPILSGVHKYPVMADGASICFLQIHGASIFCGLSLGHYMYMYSDIVYMTTNHQEVTVGCHDIHFSLMCPYFLRACVLKDTMLILPSSPKH